MERTLVSAEPRMPSVHNMTEKLKLRELAGRVTYSPKASGKEAFVLLAHWTSVDTLDVLHGETLTGHFQFKPFERQLYERSEVGCLPRCHTWKRCLYQILK